MHKCRFPKGTINMSLGENETIIMGYQTLDGAVPGSNEDRNHRVRGEIRK